MSGGSSKKSTDKTSTPASVSPMIQPGQTQSFPAGMPGQMDAIANQLSMGYGGPPADIMAMLSAMYKPMTLPALQPFDPARAATIAKTDPLKTTKTTLPAGKSLGSIGEAGGSR